MGNKAVELMKKGKHVFFAFEEAIGLVLFGLKYGTIIMLLFITIYVNT